jgi:hypothetical protein
VLVTTYPNVTKMITHVFFYDELVDQPQFGIVSAATDTSMILRYNIRWVEHKTLGRWIEAQLRRRHTSGP